MNNIYHIKQVTCPKDEMWAIINAFRSENHRGLNMSKPDVCKILGTYSTKYSMKGAKGKKLWEKLELIGILIHPKAAYNNRPLKSMYIIGLPDEEIEVAMSKIRDDGTSIQGNHEKREPVFTFMDPNHKQEEEYELPETDKARRIILNIKDVKITIEI